MSNSSVGKCPTPVVITDEEGIINPDGPAPVIVAVDEGIALELPPPELSYSSESK